MNISMMLSETHVKYVVILCDNWPGQNKNRIITHILCVATVNILNLECTDVIFLEKEHIKIVNNSVMHISKTL